MSYVSSGAATPSAWSRRTERWRTRRWRATTAMAAGCVGVVVALTAAGCGGGADQTIVAPAVPHPATAEALTESDVTAWLDGLLPAALEQSDIAGATVAVVHEGEVVTTRGYGYADTGGPGREPVVVDPEQTLFRAGSVSKLVTATAAMQLVARGELELDADIDQYLDFEIPRRYDADLTLRHLLSHTAGFEERLAGLIGTGEEPVNLREALVTDPPEQVYEPGTTPAYSNYGSSLAGYLVERVSGLPFEEYVERHIFEPWGMSSSSFRQPLPEDLRARMSNGYEASDGAAEPFERVNVPPAGSLSTPAADMARFMLAHLGELPADADQQAGLLDEPTRALLHAPALGAAELGSLADGRRMTLGFFDESRNGHRILGHGGDTRYFHSHLQIYPEVGAGIFVSLNSSGTSAADTLTLRASLLAGFADRYFPASGSEAAGSLDEPAAQELAAAAAGTYTSARGFHSTFLSMVSIADRTQVRALDDGRLLFEPGPGIFFSPAVYEAVSPTLWREVGGYREIAVRVDDGQVVAIGHDSALTLVRVGAAENAAVPLLIGAVAVMFVSVVAWPAGAALRRVRGRAPDPDGRLVRTLSRAAMVSALLALVGWATILVSVMNFQDVPSAVLRGVQALQLIGLAGLVPAGWRVADDVRHRKGWRRILASALVILALAATAWFAVEFRLLAPSISY